MFPLMTPDELRALADDIKQTDGLLSLVMLIKDEHGRDSVLDGRNRLDALELLGETITREMPIFKTLLAGRRHLTTEQWRDPVAKLLKARPKQSNRQIAEAVKVSHVTVGGVRTEMEGRGQIDHVETHTDTGGRQQRAHKSAPAVQAAVDRAVARSEQTKRREAVASTASANRSANAGNDIDPQASADRHKGRSGGIGALSGADRELAAPLARRATAVPEPHWRGTRREPRRRRRRPRNS